MSDKPPSKPSGTIRLKSVESKGLPTLNTAKKPAGLNRTPPTSSSSSTSLTSLSFSTTPSTSSSSSSHAQPTSTTSSTPLSSLSSRLPTTTTTTTTTSSSSNSSSSSGSTRPAINVNVSSGVTRNPTTSTTSTTTSAAPKSAGPRPPVAPNIVPRAKKEFTPNLVKRTKVEENKIDSMLPSSITDILKHSLTTIGTISDQKPKHDRNRQIRQGINPRAKKHGTTTSAIPNAPSLPLTQLPDSYLERNSQQRSANKETDKLNEDFVNQLFHEMEIDPMQPNHPTHLPLVDPRKVLKEYSLKDAKLDIEKKKKEIQEKIQNGEMSDGLSLDSLIEDSNNTLFSKPKKVEEQVKPFHNEGIFLNDDHLFFIQLPTSLPSSATRPVMISPLMPLPPGAKPPPGMPLPPGAKPPAATGGTAPPAAATNAANNNNPTELNKTSFVPMIYPGDFSNTMKSLPSGKLGTLKIYKSGKTILTIGSVEYHVSAGNKLKFLEEIKCITPDGPTCYTLGTPSQHLVASPMINIGAQQQDAT
ncbi:RNA polymerase III subunit [Heterostelium album PN500]|uniref:RNA polymerase III subunit n=1 Tax=Heterostelium pallidum (strain ATCC 26659 / Pp 5 / PN500) TaxID=670386 RepID=D3BFH0_HETP5|nr:RNA polymerase III subunit [Heterostelium album PN500]EFA79884.1 RNA polymerase III subunit [Heterostelium album PN500]|eukprot:XP_020432005.1 RNA polymerase III subunit [Heterostelium album PN500]